jgi:hypothetical protein
MDYKIRRGKPLLFLLLLEKMEGNCGKIKETVGVWWPTGA